MGLLRERFLFGGTVFVICDNRQGAKALLVICRQYSAFSLLLEGSHLKGSPTIVARTTGEEPKIVVTQSGKAAKEAGACVTPIPRATASPTIEVFRKFISCCITSLIPVMAMEANTEIVAPPSTTLGNSGQQSGEFRNQSGNDQNDGSQPQHTAVDNFSRK